MKIDILSLFPEMYTGPFTESILKRAQNENKVEINIHNFRDYSTDPHHNVDDTPFGGGSGMVLACGPIFDCVNSLKTKDSLVIMMTPSGKVYNQAMAYDLSHEKHLIILCGHYEGVDERIIEEIVDEEISIGDYVLTGGELPAMVLVDAVARNIGGVLSEDSTKDESFTDSLLEYPQYTRPEEFHGRKVPDVLLSGDHAKVDKWRLEKSLEITKERRPDLYDKYIKNV